MTKHDPPQGNESSDNHRSPPPPKGQTETMGHSESMSGHQPEPAGVEDKTSLSPANVTPSGDTKGGRRRRKSARKPKRKSKAAKKSRKTARKSARKSRRRRRR